VLKFQMDSPVQPIQSAKKRVDYPNLPNSSVLALLLRTIPLTTSFLLFILTVTIDANRWGSRLIQIILAIAIFVGVIGLALFIPK